MSKVYTRKKKTQKNPETIEKPNPKATKPRKSAEVEHRQAGTQPEARVAAAALMHFFHGFVFFFAFFFFFLKNDQ